MKTFYVSRNLKIRLLFILLLLILPTGWSAIWSFIRGIQIILHPDLFAKIFGAFFLGFGIVLSLFVLWMVSCLYFLPKIQLIFGPTSVQIPAYTRFKFLGPRGVKPFNLPYAQIERVKYAEIPGVFNLVDVKGVSTQFIANGFGNNNGEEVLLELKKYLPEEYFEPNRVITPLKKQLTTADVIHIILSTIVVIGYLIILVLRPGWTSYRALFLHAWNVEQNLSAFEDSEAFSAQSKNDYWLLTETLGDYKIYHQKNGRTIGQSAPQIRDGEYPQFISEDKNGNPILWLDKRVTHFDGEWKSVVYPDNMDIYSEISLRRFAVSKNQALYVEQDEQSPARLMLMDAFTGASKEIVLPESAKQENLRPFHVRPTTDEGFVVLMNGEASTRAYLFSENSWQEQVYQVLFPSSAFFHDMLLDQKGSLWLLFGNQNPEIFFVEKVTSDGAHDVTQLPLPHGEGDRYEVLLVDSHERLWVQGGYPEFMSVLQPVWFAEAHELEYYTTTNSNFSLSSPSNDSLMTTDGVILAAGYSVISMDTNLETPPAPFPWLETQDPMRLQLFLIICQIILLIFMLVRMILNRNNTLRQQAKPHVPSHQ